MLLTPLGCTLLLLLQHPGEASPPGATAVLTEQAKLTALLGAPDDHFGAAVAGAGDVNGDGYADVIVGAQHALGTGAAYVYLGSATGIDPASELVLTASDAAAGDQLGVAVRGAGDVNGDGYDDVIVGAHEADDNGESTGSVYVYLGSEDGIDPGTELELMVSDGIGHHYFGRSVCGAGDVDGDGYDDVIIGVTGDDDDGVRTGAAYLYFGSSAGIDPATETRLLASDGAAEDDLGHAACGAGDVNGDGYDDVIVGAPHDDDNGSSSGSAYVYLGTSGGIDPASEVRLLASDGVHSDTFGWSVCGAGDVDGDGYGDVIVGAPNDYDHGASSGSVYLYRGGSAGIDPGTEVKLTMPDGVDDDRFGWSACGAGDVDGDGYDDVIIGALDDDDDGTDAGAAFLYLGSSAGIDLGTELELTASDASSMDAFGVAVAGAGDVNGDGFHDVVVGAEGDDDRGETAGAAYLFTGTCRPPTWYLDADTDGYGDASSTSHACVRPEGYVGNGDDCDDAEPLAWTGASEVCDGVDNDCDGTVDNDDATDAATWYADADADGFTHAYARTTACVAPAGYADPSVVADCNDADAGVFPGAPEVCDRADNDCDGTIDEEVVDATTWYADADGDGFTAADDTVTACEAPDGYGLPSDKADCDDGHAAIYPGASEMPDDDIDQDCDGVDLAADRRDDAVPAGCAGCATGTPAGGPWLVLLAMSIRRGRRHSSPGDTT